MYVGDRRGDLTQNENGPIPTPDGARTDHEVCIGWPVDKSAMRCKLRRADHAPALHIALHALR